MRGLEARRPRARWLTLGINADRPVILTRIQKVTAGGVTFGGYPDDFDGYLAGIRM
jgi:hypothetical protein